MRTGAAIFLVALLAGCAHVVSKEARQEAVENLPAENLFTEPDSFKGRLVILGGVIINTVNVGEETHIEVLERPLDSGGRPRQTDESRGRFIVVHKGYLDNAIYAPGREITVAGTVAGTSVRPIGETTYAYPVLESRELHLIKPREEPAIRFGVGFGVFHSY